MHHTNMEESPLESLHGRRPSWFVVAGSSGQLAGNGAGSERAVQDTSVLSYGLGHRHQNGAHLKFIHMPPLVLADGQAS